MTWLTWLMLAVVVVVIAAFAGIQPKGGRPVARTELMSVARVVVVIAALIGLYLAFGSRPV